MDGCPESPRLIGTRNTAEGVSRRWLEEWGFAVARYLRARGCAARFLLLNRWRSCGRGSASQRAWVPTGQLSALRSNGLEPEDATRLQRQEVPRREYKNMPPIRRGRATFFRSDLHGSACFSSTRMVVTPIAWASARRSWAPRLGTVLATI